MEDYAFMCEKGLFLIQRGREENDAYWKVRTEYIMGTISESSDSFEKLIQESYKHANTLFYGIQYNQKIQEHMDKK